MKNYIEKKKNKNINNSPFKVNIRQLDQNQAVSIQNSHLYCEQSVFSNFKRNKFEEYLKAT